jgi:hypothetical protein
MVGGYALYRSWLPQERTGVLQEERSFAAKETGKAAPAVPRESHPAQPAPRPSAATDKLEKDSRGDIATPAPAQPEAQVAPSSERAAARPEPSIGYADQNMKNASAEGGLRKAGVEPDQYWTEGTVLPLSQDMHLSAAREKRDQDNTLSRQTGSLSATFSQAPASLLPKNERQENALRNSIPTLIRQEGNGLHFTLYLDSLMDERDLRNATLLQPGDDSLVVLMRNQQIGYRVPVQHQNRQQAKPAQVK